MLRVSCADGAWSADVGHGTGPLEPLRMAAGGWVAQDGWSFRLAEHPDGLELVERWAGEETVLYVVPDSAPPARGAAEPGTDGRLVAAQRTTKEVRRLVDRRYTRVHSNGTFTQVQGIDDDLMREILDEEFGLDLTEEQVEALLARIDAG